MFWHKGHDGDFAQRVVALLNCKGVYGFAPWPPQLTLAEVDFEPDLAKCWDELLSEGCDRLWIAHNCAIIQLPRPPL